MIKLLSAISRKYIWLRGIFIVLGMPDFTHNRGSGNGHSLGIECENGNTHLITGGCMSRLIEVLSDNSDFLIAAGIFDIILIILLDFPSKVMGGSSTIIAQNNYKGSSGIFLLVFLVGAIVVHGFLFYRLRGSWKQARAPLQ